MKMLRRSVFVCLMIVAVSIITTDAFSQSATISPETLYFGRIPEGTTADRKIVIFGTAVTPFVVSQIRFEGPDAALFSVVDEVFPFSVIVAELHVVLIRFQPQTEGAISAQMVIESNASASPHNIELTGEGTDRDAGFTVFERIFGSVYSDGIGSVRILGDGGYLLAGSTRRVDDDYEFGDATLMKTSSLGEIEWSVLYGVDDEGERFSEAIPTADGGYIAVGTWREREGQNLLPPELLVVKFDADRNVGWEKTFGQSRFRDDEGSDIVEMAGGGYLVLGTSQSIIGELPHNDAYLIKLDTSGNEVWQKLYGGAGGDDGVRIKPTSDGNYVFIGSSSTYSTGGLTDWDAWLTKIDPDGNEIWHKNYGGSEWDRSGSVIETADNGFMMTGNTSSPEFGASEPDVILIKTDADGNLMWTKTYGFDSYRDGGGEVIATDDGGYFILGGAELDYDPGLEVYYSDIYIIKTDGDGNKQWDHLLGGYHEEGASCVRQTSDGGYIIAGSSETYNPLIRHRDNYLLKLDGSGGFTDVCCDGSFAHTEFRLAQNYPNPFNNETIIAYQLPKSSHVILNVYNMNGQKVRTLIDEFKQSGFHDIHFNAYDLTSGLYFYQIKTVDFVETNKMLLLK